MDHTPDAGEFLCSRTTADCPYGTCTHPPMRQAGNAPTISVWKTDMYLSTFLTRILPGRFELPMPDSKSGWIDRFQTGVYTPSMTCTWSSWLRTRYHFCSDSWSVLAGPRRLSLRIFRLRAECTNIYAMDPMSSADHDTATRRLKVWCDSFSLRTQ